MNQLRINHYIVKSEEEAIEEFEGHSNNKHTYQMHWFKYHDRNDERDEILYRYVPTLKRVIGE